MTTQPTSLKPPRGHRIVMDRGAHRRMIEFRRDLHQHPELAWQEKRTSERVCERLRALGLEPTRICETGIVADLPGPAGVATVALRADMDALPIHEETGLSFASRNSGVMHACGHDGHTAMVLGAAELLMGIAERPAPIRLIFQPAEERGTGARRMLKAGALEGVQLIFGAHLDVFFDTGTLAVTDGPVNASTDRFLIRLTSPGAHAARPHESADTVVVGSHLVLALQTIVSRQVDPAYPAVVTVGSFKAGTVSNAIAGEAELEGTIRAQTPEVRAQLTNAVKHTAETMADLHGVELEFELDQGTPPLYNPAGPTGLARSAAEKTVGAAYLDVLPKANMGGEDFAFYLESLAGSYIRIGAKGSEKTHFPAHSSRYDFDESALEIGARWFANVAMLAGFELGGS